MHSTTEKKHVVYQIMLTLNKFLNKINCQYLIQGDAWLIEAERRDNNR